MAHDLPPAGKLNSSQLEESSLPLSSLPYARLRWAIRLTGVLLMFAGAIYLGIVAGRLVFESLTESNGSGSLYAIIISFVALGLGIFVLRVGLDMLRSVDSSAVGSFSFVFALVYTWILMQIVPASALYYRYPILMFLLFLLYLSLTFLILRYILLLLLFPQKKS